MPIKENSKIRMKMSIANELLTTNGNAISTMMPIASQIRLCVRPLIALSPAKSGRFEGERQEQHGEHHDQAGVRADELNAEGFCDPHHQAGDQRADHIAQRPQHHGDEGHQHEHLADKRIGRIERHQQRTGGARQCQRNAQRDAKNPIGVDPHQRRHVTVLGCGAHRLAKVGGVQEDPERAAQYHRHHKGDQFRHRDVKPADVKGFIRIRGMDGAVIGREQHQREIQQQQRQRERQKDLRHVVGSENPADQEMLDQDADHEQHRHRHE